MLRSAACRRAPSLTCNARATTAPSRSITTRRLPVPPRRSSLPLGQRTVPLRLARHHSAPSAPLSIHAKSRLKLHHSPPLPVRLSLPPQTGARRAFSTEHSSPKLDDPTFVFPILAALILSAALALLSEDSADAEENTPAVQPFEAERAAVRFAQAGLTLDEMREQTSPFFRIVDAPPDLTIVERIEDAFWATVEAFKMIFRVWELSLRFTPVILTSPLLMTRWADLWYRILLGTLRRSGPCFIKLGQWAATRRDIFPEDFTHRLATLHTQAPFHTLEETREVFRRVYGREVEELFDEFDPEPIASGAIAQVYRARLKKGKADSGDLVLKVRHPGVAEDIARDLRILRRAVQVMTWVLGLGWLNPVDTVDVFRGNMLAQVDLAVEAANLERFRNNFAGVNTVRFPRPVRLLCRPEVLVESFEEGKLISEYVSELVDPKLRRNIASLGMNTYLKMMIEDSFTHADLHPGNILVDTRSNPPQLVILDCGLVVRLSQKDRRNFINLFSAVIEGDSQLAAKLMTYDQPHLSTKAVREFGAAIDHPIAELRRKGLAQINVSQVMSNILSAARQHKVRVDPAFTTLVVGTAVLEGLGRQLDPQINLIKHAEPFLRGEPVARRAYIRSMLNRGLFWG